MPAADPSGRSAAESLIARIDASAGGEPVPDTVPTGFPSLDKALGGGLRRQDLVVLGGDVGSGKSALALAIALRSARAGIPVAFLSGEMSERRVLERAVALESRVPVDSLRTGQMEEPERARVGAAALAIERLPLAIRPLDGDPAALDGAGAAPGLVVVDSLQHLSPPQASVRLEERVAAAARMLKARAIAGDAAVLAVAQLPRFRADRADPRPRLDDLGGLGAVKQQADVVLGVYREEMYRPGHGVEGATELLVLKHRNGPTGFVDLYFYARWLRFEDMLDPEP